MKISVEQSGGYAGQTTRLADIDTEQLDPGTAQESRADGEGAQCEGSDVRTHWLRSAALHDNGD